MKKIKADSIDLVFDGDDLNNYNGLCVDAVVGDGYVDFEIYFENQEEE